MEHERLEPAHDRGFTLIELLVVVIVIGVLAAIAIPTFLNQKNNAYLASVKGDLRTAVIAIESTAIETGSYLAVNGADETTLEFITRGYEGSEHTSLLVTSDQLNFCVEAEDVRNPGVVLVSRSGVVGFDRDDDGC